MFVLLLGRKRDRVDGEKGGEEIRLVHNEGKRNLRGQQIVVDTCGHPAACPPHAHTHTVISEIEAGKRETNEHRLRVYRSLPKACYAGLASAPITTHAS